jgi:hypothetical protein
MWKPDRLMLTATAAVASAAALSGAANVPRPWAPWSLVTVLPGFLAATIAMPFLANEQRYVSPAALQAVAMGAAGLFVALVFLISTRRRLGLKRIPDGSLRGFTVAAAADFLLLGMSWTYGVEYNGLLHTSVVVGYNLIALAGCIALYAHNHRTPSRATNVAFHTLFFVALGYCAFPWLGELP